MIVLVMNFCVVLVRKAGLRWCMLIFLLFLLCIGVCLQKPVAPRFHFLFIDVFVGGHRILHTIVPSSNVGRDCLFSWVHLTTLPTAAGTNPATGISRQIVGQQYRGKHRMEMKKTCCFIESLARNPNYTK